MSSTVKMVVVLITLLLIALVAAPFALLQLDNNPIIPIVMVSLIIACLVATSTGRKKKPDQ